jgi:uncharacterized protein
MNTRILNNRKIRLLLIYIMSFYITITFINLIQLKTNLTYMKYDFALLGKIIHINITDIFIRLMIFFIPVFIILKIEKEKVFEFLKLKGNYKKALIWSLLGIITVIFIAFWVALFYIKVLNIYITINFKVLNNIDKIVRAVIITGFIEEIVFRGFIFQKLLKITDFWKANILNGLLFAFHHFPFWIIYTHKINPIHALCVFIFALIQGFIIKKSNSLWPCIVFHMVNNLVGFILGADIYR